MKKEYILIVDDMEINRAILAQSLESDYQILEAGDGEEALKLIGTHFKEIVAILLDISMPKVDGFQVMDILKKKNALKYIPIILVTADSSAETVRKAYQMGAVEHIAKPFDVQVVREKVRTVTELYWKKKTLEAIAVTQNKKLRTQEEQLKELNINLLEIVGTIVEFRGLESSQHIKRVKAITKIMTEYVAEYYKEYELTQMDVQVISAASAMHDVGKILIPDSILLKPGRLTADEFEVMKSHTTKGSEVIDAISEYQNEQYHQICYDIVRFHHERYDGKGYPEGLKGDEIPISAQIVSITEAFDALISNRVYKAGVSVEKAYQTILEGYCGVFSPKILEGFTECRNKIEKVVQECPEIGENSLG